jgi:hypothetical protein
MTPTDPLDDALRHNVRRAESAVAHRMADARAHMLAGDVALADRRLAELASSLVSEDGMRGIIPEARAAAYFDAYRLTPFRPDVHAPAWQHPHREGADAARHAPEARRDVAALIDGARHVLPLLAGDAAAVDAWREQHAATIARGAATAISDGQMAVFWATNHLRTKAELRGDHERPADAGAGQAEA